MNEYQLTDTSTVVRIRDNAFIPDDIANTDRVEYEAWLAAGNIPAPYTPPIMPAQPVSPRQARIALLNAGLLDQVEAAVDQAGAEAKIYWDYSLEIHRDAPLIKSIGQSMGLTDSQLDDLFTQASKI